MITQRKSRRLLEIRSIGHWLLDLLFISEAWLREINELFA
jgi:hypothetical protein